MTDLLNPKVVKEWQQRNESLEDGAWFNNTIDTLCRNYLTLWDELEHERDLSDKAVKRVTQLEQEIGALMR